MPPEVVLTAASREVRAAVGPVAWVVLEELAVRGEPGGSSVTVATTVRELGEALGLSKDTVAAALRRLASDGIVRRDDERDGGSGRFGHSRYVVDLSDTGMRFATHACHPQPRTSDTATVEPESPPTPVAEVSPRQRTKSTRARRASAGAQLSLLDADQRTA